MKYRLVMIISHPGYPQVIKLMEDVPGVDVDKGKHAHHSLEKVVRHDEVAVTQ